MQRRAFAGMMCCRALHLAYRRPEALSKGCVPAAQAGDDNEDEDEDDDLDEPFLKKAADEPPSQRPAGTPSTPVASLSKQTPLSQQEESSLQARIPAQCSGPSLDVPQRAEACAQVDAELAASRMASAAPWTPRAQRLQQSMLPSQSRACRAVSVQLFFSRAGCT